MRLSLIILKITREWGRAYYYPRGGPAINRELGAQGLQSHTLNGIRVTNEVAIKVVQSTLIGQVNTALVHELTTAGIATIGLNGFDNQLIVVDF